jgi:hypothetical protein
MVVGRWLFVFDVFALRLLFFFLLLHLLSSSSSSAPVAFDEPSSFHRISVHDRPLYLDPTAPSIPCGYMAPTELDTFRYAPLQSQAVTTVTEETFNPNECTIMIVRLLFGASEIFSPQARKYLKLSPRHYHGESLCYLLITDHLSFKNPVIAESLLTNRSSPQDSRWHVFVMKNPIYANPTKTMEVIKLSLFRLFPLAKFILYYDLKYQMQGDPLKFLALCYNRMKQADVSHAIYRSRFDRTIRNQFTRAQERLRVQAQHKRRTKGKAQSNPLLTEELSDLDRQQKQYEAEGFFDLVKGQKNLLVDSAILVFQNQDPAGLHRFFCAWMNEVILYSSRDQLSYSYVEHKLNITGYKIPQAFLSKYFQKIPHETVPRLAQRTPRKGRNKKNDE